MKTGRGHQIANRLKRIQAVWCLRAPGVVYWPVFLKQWSAEGALWLWELFRQYYLFYLALVMLGFCWVIGSEEGFWFGLIGGTLVGFLAANFVAMVGLVVAIALCLFVELVCTPFHFVARCCGWGLPDLPPRLAALARETLARKKRERLLATSGRKGFGQKCRYRERQNRLFAVVLMVVGIGWLFDHFGDGE